MTKPSEAERYTWMAEMTGTRTVTALQALPYPTSHLCFLDAWSLLSPTQTALSHSGGEVVASHFKDHVTCLCLQLTPSLGSKFSEKLPEAGSMWLSGWILWSAVSTWTAGLDAEMKRFSRRRKGWKADQTPLSQWSTNRMLLCPQGLMEILVKCSFLFLLQSPVSFPGIYTGVRGARPWENLSYNLGDAQPHLFHVAPRLCN